MDINAYLVDLADKLDRQGHKVCADAVDSMIGNQSLVKVAQYVGAIGYVLKQNRALCNCIRRKRVTANSSMQEVIMDCLKEYQDGQDYRDNEWTSKYASVIRSSPDRFKNAHLEYIAQLGSQNNISQHIVEVEKVAQILENNKVNDNFLTTVLNHIKQFGNIIQKDKQTSKNANR